MVVTKGIEQCKMKEEEKAETDQMGESLVSQQNSHTDGQTDRQAGSRPYGQTARQAERKYKYLQRRWSS